MDKKEMIKFKGHQLQPYGAEEQVVVPHFKGLVKNYRASFPMMEPQLTKVSFIVNKDLVSIKIHTHDLTKFVLFSKSIGLSKNRK